MIRRALNCALDVRRRYNKGVLAQLYEIQKYYRGSGKLGPSDYYDYRLFDDSTYTPELKADFVGWRMERWLDQVLNGEEWRGAANDKLQFYALMHANGFEIPAVYAILHPLARSFGATPSFRNKAELSEFLRTRMTYPVFAKPAHSSSARGTVLLVDYLPDDDAFVHLDGRHEALEDFVSSLHDPRGSGYLFLEFLRPHEGIHAVCGPRLSTLRIIVLMKPDGPEIFRAVWKVQTGDNIFDNFGLVGETGNLCASVDVRSGEVDRVIGRTGLDQTVHEEHPDTGARLVGFEIPEWQETVDACRRAALVYPKLHFQHWDVAVTSRGPVMLECNVSGGVGIPQLASRRGLYNEELRELVRQQLGQR